MNRPALAAALCLLPLAALAAPTKMAFLSPVPTVATGRCSPEVSIQLQDASGAAAPAPQAIALGISGPAGYYASATCSDDPLDRNAFVFAQGQSVVKFRFVHPRVGALTLSASSPSLGTISQAIDVTLGAGAPATFAFTAGPVSVPLSTCSPALNWVFKDAAGNPATADRTLVVSFLGQFTEFYSDAACATRLQTVQAAPGATGGQLFARIDTLGTVQVKISSPGLDTAQTSLSSTGTTSGGCSSSGAAAPALAGLAFLLVRRRLTRATPPRDQTAS